MIRRREFIAALGGAAAWPLAARAQQRAMPVVGLMNLWSQEASADNAAAFRKGLGESGYVEGQNVRVEYPWLDGQPNRVPAPILAAPTACGGVGRAGKRTLATPHSKPPGHPPRLLTKPAPMHSAGDWST